MRRAPAAKSAAKAAPAKKEDARESAEKAEREKREASMARENCERSYFMEDAQRARETAKTRESVSQWCK